MEGFIFQNLFKLIKLVNKTKFLANKELSCTKQKILITLKNTTIIRVSTKFSKLSNIENMNID